mmetsp:Transcript_20411/g.28346  ORF Transcript_20411/g.28346 Transcript_20411/m.28346 type:complete len:701 (-) Transcript_20411:201-2303(-)
MQRDFSLRGHCSPVVTTVRRRSSFIVLVALLPAILIILLAIRPQGRSQDLLASSHRIISPSTSGSYIFSPFHVPRSSVTATTTIVAPPPSAHRQTRRTSRSGRRRKAVACFSEEVGRNVGSTTDSGSGGQTAATSAAAGLRKPAPEIRNWVRLEDGRFQGEVYHREGISEGKVIATSQAQVLNREYIQTDTGAIYKLNPPMAAGAVGDEKSAGIEEDTGEEQGTSTQHIDQQQQELSGASEESYDPFKSLIRNLGATAPSSSSSSPPPPSLMEDISTEQQEADQNTIKALTQEQLAAAEAGTDDPSVLRIVEARGAEIELEQPAEIPEPVISQSQETFSEILSGGGAGEGMASSSSSSSSSSSPSPSNSRAGPSSSNAVEATGEVDVVTKSEVASLTMETDAAAAAAAVLPTTSAESSLPTTARDNNDGDDSVSVIMPQQDVRKASLQEDQLMTDQIAQQVSETETKIAKKGTNWLTGLLAKGAATLVNSPVSVNNQFNTVIQYNFGDGQKKTLSECKSELLMEISGVDRGLKATEEAQEKIEKLVRAMEAGNPTKTPLKNPLLNGRWALLYTTAKGVLGEGNPIRPSGPIYQSIDIFGLRILNEQAYEPFPFVRWTTSAAGDLFPKSNSRAEVKFEQYRVGGVKVVAPPTDPARQMIEWELEVSGKGTPAWLDNTYVDENLRVARDHKGNVFVMKRDDP